MARFENGINTSLACGDLHRAAELASAYRDRAGPVVRGELAFAPAFRAAYISVPVELAAGRLLEALKFLTPYLSRTAELPPDLARRVHLLGAEILARLDRRPEAERQLDATAELPASRDPLVWLRELRIRLWLGEVDRLRNPIDRCLVALQRAGDTANQALLLCEEGRAWDLRGDLDHAEECWLRADRLHRPGRIDPIRADVLIQLGRLAHLVGRLQEALDRLEAVSDHMPSDAPQQQEAELRLMLVRLDLNQWNAVAGELDEFRRRTAGHDLPNEIRGLASMVEAVLGNPKAGDESAEQRGFRLAVDGDLAGARDQYREAVATASEPVRKARSALSLGLLAFATGDVAEAGRWLQQAEKLAREQDLPEVLWRALQGRGRLAAELLADEKLARTLFEEALRVSETQARRLRRSTDAAAYRDHRQPVSRQLLRAAFRRHASAEVFAHQELDRGRLLFEMWRTADSPPRDSSAEMTGLAELDRLLNSADPTNPEVPAWEARRDRLLEKWLSDRSRAPSALLPAQPRLEDLVAVLPPGWLYLAPSLVDDDLMLLAVTRSGATTRVVGDGARVRGRLVEFRSVIAKQLERYRFGLPMGPCQREELDAALDGIGNESLGDLLREAVQHAGDVRRIVWVPDADLHGLPFAAVRREGRYLVEGYEVVHAFSGALFVQQMQSGRRRCRRFGPAVIVAEAPEVLPEAGAEARGVAETFLRACTLLGKAGDRATIRNWLPKACMVHFACHAYFDPARPIAAAIGLPSGELWRAVEWLGEPVAGLPLVTLGACRSAEVATLVGQEVFGLVSGLLGGGVRAVLAGMWPVADRETRMLMGSFYRHRLTADLASALALAQREAIAGADASPLYWAAFCLHGDPAALPTPGIFTHWWYRRRAARLARRQSASLR